MHYTEKAHSNSVALPKTQATKHTKWKTKYIAKNTPSEITPNLWYRHSTGWELGISMHQLGIEPRSQEWEPCMIPLHHWCFPAAFSYSVLFHSNQRQVIIRTMQEKYFSTWKTLPEEHNTYPKILTRGQYFTDYSLLTAPFPKGRFERVSMENPKKVFCLFLTIYTNSQSSFGEGKAKQLHRFLPRCLWL